MEISELIAPFRESLEKGIGRTRDNQIIATHASDLKIGKHESGK